VIAVAVGAAPPAATLERARALGVADRWVTAGRLDDLQAAYAAFDVLVVPSVRDESLPLVVLEAMAAARPVFASRLSGLPEAVRDGVTGRLFEPGDAAGLAALLRSRDGLRELGDAGRRAWAERYAPEAVTAAALAVYS
jgi:glycosyltransferase involved in cell wall biosynthesis